MIKMIITTATIPPTTPPTIGPIWESTGGGGSVVVLPERGREREVFISCP